MPPIHLLIKPSSGSCNLNCSYCFYRDITEKREQALFGFMSLDTLENVIRKALIFADSECTLAYQGGEPTLVGLEFYRKSVELQQEYNRKNLKIHNAIQTNGFGLDAQWASFFHDNNFLVGLSLDGTKDTHDAFRHDYSNKDTFNEIMKTVNLFNNYKVEYNILTVVNARTAKRINSIYSFFKKNNFEYLQFIPCLNPLGEENEKYDYTLTSQAYGHFLKTLFELWYQDFISGKQVHIRQFENYIEMLLGYPPESCGMSGVCSFQNVIEADGEVYPCDFYVLDEFKLGNLNSVDFEQIEENRRQTQFVEISTKVHEDCKTCEYMFICRGGCKRYREPCIDGEYGLNRFCSAYKDFFSYALPRLHELAQRIRKGGI